MRKRRFTLLLTVALALTLTACTSTEPAELPMQDEQEKQLSQPVTSAEATSKSPATSESTPTEKAITTPPIQPAPTTKRTDNITEINLTALTAAAYPKGEVWKVVALDNRYVIVKSRERGHNVHHSIMFHLFDTEALELVYSTELFKGNWWGRFIYNGTKSTTFYAYKQSSNWEVYTDHSLIHFTPTGYTIETLEMIDEEPPRRIVEGKQLIHENGGIYNEVDGVLVELVPATVNSNFDSERLKFESNSLAFHFDEHRFVYMVQGYEWTAGFGVYDFWSGTNFRIPDTTYMWPFATDGKKYIYTMKSDLYNGNADNTGIYATDIDTFETIYLFDENKFAEDNNAPWCMINTPAVSPDKTKMVIPIKLQNYSEEPKRPHTFIVHYLPELTVAATYYIESVHDDFARVDFMGNNQVLVHGSAVAKKDMLVFLIDLD